MPSSIFVREIVHKGFHYELNLKSALQSRFHINLNWGYKGTLYFISKHWLGVLIKIPNV